jgi:hypothetical protein
MTCSVFVPPEPIADARYRPNALNKFALSTFSLQLRALLDIKKGDEIFVSYLALPETTPKRQATLAPYGFQCTCASCTLPSYDHLYQKFRDCIMHLYNSFDKWVQDRSLPQDHLIKQALALVPLLETNGFYCMNIYEINFVTLMKCYVALGDLPNAMKYSNICGIWHLVREGNSELYEGMKNPQAHLRNSGWGARA